MKYTINEVEEWWGRSDGKKRAFFRDIMELAEAVEDGQLLRLEYKGDHFAPALYGDQSSGAALVKIGAEAELDPDEWWAELPDEMRAGVHVLAGLVGELFRDRNKAIEVRRTVHGFKATLVLRLKRPVGGCAVGN